MLIFFRQKKLQRHLIFPEFLPSSSHLDMVLSFLDILAVKNDDSM